MSLISRRTRLALGFPRLENHTAPGSPGSGISVEPDGCQAQDITRITDAFFDAEVYANALSLVGNDRSSSLSTNYFRSIARKTVADVASRAQKDIDEQEELQPTYHDEGIVPPLPSYNPGNPQTKHDVFKFVKTDHLPRNSPATFQPSSPLIQLEQKMYSTLTTLSFLITTTLTNAQSSIPSSVLPTLVQPTPTSLGNAFDITIYPLCAQPIQQTCSNETGPSLGVAVPGCDYFTATPECLCSAYYRSVTVACEEVTCSETDFQTTQKLAQQLCGPLYSKNSTLSTSVASAIASATASASAAVSGRDPRNLETYPACAVSILDTHFQGAFNPVYDD
ncbi:MAG: hypothetical protein Q9186_001206 [Xanthomendoza sp. 1 TL-2023]